jgi:hypothetical protein
MLTALLQLQVVKVTKDITSWLESPTIRQAAEPASRLAASAAKGALDAGGGWLRKQFAKVVSPSKGGSDGSNSVPERASFAADVSRAVGQALKPVTRLAAAVTGADANQRGDQSISISEIEEVVQTLLSYRPGCSAVSFVVDSAAALYSGGEASTTPGGGVSVTVSKGQMVEHSKDMEVALLAVEAISSKVQEARAALDPQLYEVLQQFYEVRHIVYTCCSLRWVGICMCTKATSLVQ